MLKIQFKRKKPPEIPPPESSYRGDFVFGANPPNEGSLFGQDDIFAAQPQAVQAQPIDNSCLFCGSEIEGSHLLVTTKGGEHYVHPSCIVSGFALLANGVGILLAWLSQKKERR